MRRTWGRRELLAAGITGIGFGTAGCQTLMGSSEDERATDVSSVSFEFSYEGTVDAPTVRIEHDGGDGVVAGDLTVRTSDGDSALWSALGSTSERIDERVTEGSAARIGASVVNWPSAVAPTETVKLLYTPEENSVTELDRYRPPTPTPTPSPTPTPTPSPTPTSSPTPTPTPSPTPTPAGEVVDTFTDGDLSEWTTAERGASGYGTWSIASEHPLSGRYAAKYQGDRKQVIASTTGLDTYPSRGDTVEVGFYKGSAEATGSFGFGVQSWTFARGYRVRVRNHNWANRAQTAALVRRDGGEKATLDEVDYEPGAHVGERLRWTLEWAEPTVRVRAFDADGSELVSLSADDSTYHDGGVAIEANASDPGTVYADGLRIVDSAE